MEGNLREKKINPTELLICARTPQHSLPSSVPLPKCLVREGAGCDPAAGEAAAGVAQSGAGRWGSRSPPGETGTPKGPFPVVILLLGARRAPAVTWLC